MLKDQLMRSQSDPDRSFLKPKHRNIFSSESLKGFFLPTLSFIAYQYAVGLPFIICGIFVGNLGDSLSLAIFGLNLTFLTITSLSVQNALAENLGVNCSRLYSGMEYDKVAGMLWKAMINLIVLNVVNVYVAYKSYGVMVFLQIDETIAYYTSIMIIQSIPYIIIQSVNSTFVSFLSSQGVSEPLIYINAVSIVIVAVTARLFIVDFGYKHTGFVIAKSIQETINFVIYMGLMIYKIHPETFRFPTFRRVFQDYREYIVVLLKTMMCYYGEYIGFEIATYYAALLHSVSDLALFCTFGNFTFFVFLMSFGLSNTYRTYVGKIIGEGRFKAARTLTQQFLLYSISIAFISIMIICAFKYEIGWIYTGDPILSVRFAGFMGIYCCLVYGTLNFAGVCSIYRLLGHDNYLLVLTIVGYPSVLAIVGYFCCFTLGMGVTGIVIAVVVARLVVFIHAVWKLFFRVEWKKSSSAAVEPSLHLS
jgi:Na+-driven multidrug efflux pump